MTDTRKKEIEQTKQQLRSWYKDALIEVNAAKEELLNAQKRLSDAEQRVKSIESLLILENEPLFESELKEEGGKADLIDVSVSILEDMGRPMRISEIRDQLLERNVPLPGKGNDANLIAAFQRSDGRIIRVSRGLYGVPQQKHSATLVFPNEKRVYLDASTRIGRMSENEIVIANKEISPEHAEITVSPDGEVEIISLVEDGLKVNNRSVKKKKLKSGDTFSLGSMEFTIEIQ